MFILKCCYIYPRSKEPLLLILQQALVRLVVQTERLQKLVSQFHQLVHANVLVFVKRDAKQLQDHVVGVHVAQKALDGRMGEKYFLNESYGRL